MGIDIKFELNWDSITRRYMENNTVVQNSTKLTISLSRFVVRSFETYVQICCAM